MRSRNDQFFFICMEKIRWIDMSNERMRNTTVNRILITNNYGLDKYYTWLRLATPCDVCMRPKTEISWAAKFLPFILSTFHLKLFCLSFTSLYCPSRMPSHDDAISQICQSNGKKQSVSTYASKSITIYKQIVQTYCKQIRRQ